MQKIVLSILGAIALVAFLSSPIFIKFLSGAGKFFGDFNGLMSAWVSAETVFLVVTVVVVLIVGAISAY